MIHNKLIKKLTTLNRKEMTRFYEFVSSAYFNKHEKVGALVAYLESIYPKFTKKNCDRYRLFRTIFPEESEHDQHKLALIFTYSQRLLEKFLSIEYYLEDDFLQNQHLLHQLKERKLFSLYEKKLEKQLNTIEDQPKKNNNHYYQGMLIFNEADLYYTLLAKHDKDRIQQKQAFLDKFYLSEKIKDATEMKVRGKILKNKYYPGLISAVLTEVKENWDYYKDSPTITIYYWIYYLVSGGEQSIFFQIRDELSVHHQAFTREELQSLYNHLQHYCFEQINKGEDKFYDELFKLYLSQLNEGLFLEDGFLSEWHYKNIVTTGLRLKKMGWVNQFIEEYKSMLLPKSQENAYTYNKASYYYEIKEFNKVMELLIRVEYTDLRYSLGAKALLLRNYYDMEEYDAFSSLCESFRQFLSRNTVISDSRREGFSNLIRFAKRTFQLKHDKDYNKKEKIEKDKERLINEIQQAKVVFNQNWLLQKIQEIA